VPRPAGRSAANPRGNLRGGASEDDAVLESGEASMEALGCPSLIDQCSPGASTTSTAFCPTVSPFKKATCLGGCCFSSGKCTSSSCAISGIGKEVSNTICYGLNPAIAIGASPNCRGLACKLAVPGCTSDLLGGSCVGTVIDLAGTAQKKNPAGAALVGFPCLDVTPSDKTLTKEGTLSSSGEYVAKLWSICDCKASTISSREGLFGLPKFGRLNVTDIKSLVEVLKPGNFSSHSWSHMLDAVKSKLPPLLVPEGENPVNLTNAIGLIGQLVGKGQVDGEPSSMSAVLDLIKGASAVAAASNSSNPLGSLLGALAPKNGDKTNPLAGLGNLVNALAPEGADLTEKSDVLSSLLGQLSSGASSAPSAELIGAVSKILAGSGGDSPAANLAGLMSKLNDLKGKNGTDTMKKLMAAVNQGKEAANGKIDLAGILAKAKQFVSKADGTDGTNPAIAQILASVQALAQPNSQDGNSPLAFLTALGGEKNLTMQGMLDLAAKAGPVLQQLQGGAGGAGGAGGGRFAGLMSALKGGEGGEGVDMPALVSLASKLGPVLQSIKNSGGPGADPLAKILSAVGLGEEGAAGNINWKGLAEAAQKAGPMLQALTKSASGANANLAGLQSFLDKVSGSKATA